MGDAASAQERGLAALERARSLDKAGKTKEAVVLYKVRQKWCDIIYGLYICTLRIYFVFVCIFLLSGCAFRIAYVALVVAPCDSLSGFWSYVSWLCVSDASSQSALL